MDRAAPIRAFLATAAILGLAVACGYAKPTAARGELVVIVDPKVTSERAMRVGENVGAPIPGLNSVVTAKREPDGTVLVEVRSGRNENTKYTTVSQVWVRETPQGLTATAKARSQATDEQAASSGQVWPFVTMRGSIKVNRAALASPDASDPFVLDSELTGSCSGSDSTLRHRVVLTEADLR